MMGDGWTADQHAVAQEMRALGRGFIEIADVIGQPANMVHTVCEARGYKPSVPVIDAERKRTTEGAITAAAALLTNRGKSVEKIADGLYRVAGVPMRAARVLDLADAPR